MYTVWVRLSTVFFYAITVLAGLAAMCSLSTFVFEYNYELAKLESHDLFNLRPNNPQMRGMGQKKADTAAMSFDMEADLTPIWNWNVKQLFVFITAEYTNSKYVVIWDKIITSEEDSKLVLDEEFIKYHLVDIGSRLRNASVTLRLNWDVMPVVGYLWPMSAAGGSVEIPGTYGRLQEGEWVALTGGSRRRTGV